MSDHRCGKYAGFMAHMADNSPICPDCKEARLRYNKRLRLDHARGIKRTLPILGSRRRLQALAALGYTQTELADRLGVTKQRVYQWTAQERYRRIYPATAEKIAEIYTHLCMTVPVGPRRDDLRRKARTKGYLPPLMWDDIDRDVVNNAIPKKKKGASGDIDPVVVSRVLGGDAQVVANPLERTQIARLWVESGRPLSELARLTGWKTERYYRHKDAA